jgi:hypothetical protein
MTSETHASRRGLTPRERTLLKELINAEVRRRDDADLESIAASKCRHEARVGARKRML